ncbi:MAG: hypothetical protein Q8N60_04305 [Candidatus Diapherotrites archaeon]|jgi:hypothetical protein|nr:hypothetical protein [Candidatus Diapherotrites archaeon]
MRISVDDMIAELQLRLQETKGLHNKVLLQDALKSLQDFKRVNEKPL